MGGKSPKSLLLDLPNCILLDFFQYLDSSSLYNLSRTCERFKDLVNTSILWRRIDARSPPNDLAKIDFCIDQVHKLTEKLLLQGDSNTDRVNITLPIEIFTKLENYDNLKILALESVTLPELYSVQVEDEFEEFHMKHLPKNLTELSLRKSHMVYPSKFFRFSDESTTNLRVLILDECEWLTSSILLPLAKYKNLEILSMYKCPKIEDSIPYLGLAGVCGFKQLKIIDARHTKLGNTLIQSVYRSKSIQAIYLNVHNMSSPPHAITVSPTIQLSDKGMFCYNNATSIPKIPKIFDSYLYTDPYGNCTCKSARKRSRSDLCDDNRPTGPKRRRLDDPGPSRPLPIEIPHRMFDEIIQIVVDGHGREFETPLRRLSIRGSNQVTDASLRYLKYLDLDVLDLTCTNVTEAGIKDYLKDNPRCQIIHSKYCVCRDSD